VSPASPSHLFERLFGEVPADIVAATAALSASLDSDGAAELGNTPEDSAALLAAYLDGTLHGDDAVLALLAASSPAFHEAIAAADFIDAVTMDRSQAPGDIVATALIVPPPARRPRWAWRISGAAAVLAMAALAAMLILGRPVSTPGETTVPMANVPLSAPLPAASGETAPLPKARPPQQMMPAGNMDTVPVPKGR
jgi:hypothetical protein